MPCAIFNDEHILAVIHVCIRLYVIACEMAYRCYRYLNSLYRNSGKSVNNILDLNMQTGNE